MIDIGDVVKVVSYRHTEKHCGRKSSYDMGESFIVNGLSIDIRGIIVSDDDYNFVHELDLMVVRKNNV